MNLSTKIAYNTMVQVASKIIATILGLFAVAIITRYLGREGFGEYTTVMTFLSFFAILADLGLTLVTVQMISQPNVNINRILGNLLGLRLVSGVLFIGLAPFIVLLFPYSEAVKLGVALTAINFLFIAVNQIFVGLFQKNLRMDRVSIAEVAGRIMLVLGVLVSVHFNYGLSGILVATVLAGGINCLLHYIYAKKFTRLKLFFDIKIWKEIIAKSWPLGLTIFFNLVYLRADILLLSLMHRKTEIGIIAEVGIYGAAYRVVDVLITFPYVFIGIILPIITLRWAQGDKTGFNSIMQKAFELMIILAIPLAIGTQFISTDVVVLVTGEDFALAGPILQVIIIAASLIYIGVVFAHGIIAVNKWKKLVPVFLFTAVTAVIAYILLIPHYSYWGAAWITIYSELFIVLAQAYYLYKFTGFIPNLKIVGKTILASLIMASSIIAIQKFISPNLYLVIGSAIPIYCIAIYLLGGINKQELISLFRKSS